MLYKSRQFAIIFIDLILLNISILFSYYVRFGGEIPAQQLKMHWENVFIILLIKIVVLFLFGLYTRILKYININDLLNIVAASVVSNSMVITYIYLSDTNVPRSIYAIATLMDIILIGGIRIFVKTFRTYTPYQPMQWRANRKRIMIIGGGDAGASVVEEILNKPYNMNPVCIIDDNKQKRGRKILGVPIVGDRTQIEEQARKRNIDEIFIAIPSLSKKEISNIIEECNKTGCKIKILPSLHEIIYEKVSIKKLRDVSVEDLLGREAVVLRTIENGELKIENYKEKRILITGGGGSIGSEICRQVAFYEPLELVILEISENNVYHIEQELRSKYKELNIEPVIASVRDEVRIREIFDKYRPEVVFHAAAHKHVPLMESNASEAIKNNVFGTLNIVKAAHDYQVEKFVLISTDKAVNPTNVMGATKRVCEMIIQGYSRISKTEFAAVRFGNVLNSEGSVIPLFRKQIEEGGPVTVTHPDIIRYFMTIPEAVQLVLQTGLMAKGGEIFVLDMGEPVKIDKLARDIIRLSGFEPDKDIEIIYTGLRPGEKLYEELLINEDNVVKTSNEKIFVEKAKSIDIDKLLSEISGLTGIQSRDEIWEKLGKIIEN